MLLRASLHEAAVILQLFTCFLVTSLLSVCTDKMILAGVVVRNPTASGTLYPSLMMTRVSR